MSRRLPVISGWAVMAENGALCTYGPRLAESYRRTAYFVDRILKGSTPAELPIERPTVFELVVNLNSAKTLGIAIPSTVLAQADRVIEWSTPRPLVALNRLAAMSDTGPLLADERT
jgi:putative ABC transport system substrate-binding protein